MQRYHNIINNIITGKFLPTTHEVDPKLSLVKPLIKPRYIMYK